jgi:uncharacterized surface protein with fasciclin (FAS1) repeats
LCSPSSPLKRPSLVPAISSWDALTTRTTIDLERVRKSAHVNTDLAAHFVMEEIRAMANQFWSAP